MLQLVRATAFPSEKQDPHRRTSLPWPVAGDFQFQGEAGEGQDQDDRRQDRDAAQRGWTATVRMMSADLSHPPIVVCGGDGLKLDGHDMPGGDEAFRRSGVVRSTATQDIEIGLDVVDGVPGDG